MKKTNIIYWVFTGLACAFMLMASITDLIPIKEAVEGFKQLGYPVYLLPFLGVARILGVIAILIPGYPRLKEWAYAGFFFDLIGATYSAIATGVPFVNNTLALVVAAFFIVSYIYHHKRLNAVMA